MKDGALVSRAIAEHLGGKRHALQDLGRRQKKRLGLKTKEAAN